MKRCLQLAFVVSCLLLAILPQGFAASLRITDGTAAGTVVIDDNSALDLNPGLGSITYSGPVGPNWTVNIISGITKPLVGGAFNPFMDLSNSDTSKSNGVLTVEFSDTGFIPSGVLTAAVGGNTPGNIVFSTWLDTNNVLFATNTFLESMSEVGSPFNQTTNVSVVVPNLYSLTMLAVIKHPSSGRSGFDSEIFVTPTPSRPSCPPDVTLQCSDSVNPTNPIVGMPTIDEAPACLPVNATYVDTVTPGTNCSVDHLFATISRDWTLIDSCSVTSSCVQTLYITDTNAPAFVNYPQDISLPCNPQLIPTPDITAVTAVSDCCTPTISTNAYDNRQRLLIHPHHHLHGDGLLRQHLRGDAAYHLDD